MSVGHRAVFEDPLPDLDLPQRIRIPQHDVADAQEEQVHADADADRQKPSRDAADRNAADNGNRHWSPGGDPPRTKAQRNLSMIAFKLG
jgi:hypothetical protein